VCVCGIQFIGSSGDSSENSASLECFVDDVKQNPLTVLLGLTPVDVTSTDCVDDVRLRLCLPRACEKVVDICIDVTVLDLTRSALRLISS